ncbi:MAG: citrate synthase [Candidatus Thermoplasmatota archaeon]|nr:citrate synthase [Candidatus Thermoplasmatota archaeon]
MAADRGLRGIVAGKSSLSLVDGLEGRLIYRGYDILDLAVHSTFEETVYLMWHERLPKRRELEDFKKALVQERQLSEEQLRLLSTFPKDALPMEVLRTMVSHMALFDPDRGDNSPEANLRKGTRLVATFPAFAGAFHRIRNGEEFLPSSPEMDHAASFLHMLHGKEPTPEAARSLDICLLLHVDHEFNASTFSARVTAATLSDLYSAIVSAIGTLKGPLHGGANENAMRMLRKIGELSKAEDYVVQALGRKERIPGFGHPVYKTMDPRATILKDMSKRVCEGIGEPKWYEMSALIQEIMMREKGLYPNVDFYSATTLYALGIPLDLFSTFFACGRVPGWIGHVMEQYSDNRLIRPLSEYIGSKDLKYVPIDER